MTKDEMAEAVARAICRAETLPPYTPEQAWASNEDDFRQAAQAVLSAVSQAGYAVVPVEATPAIVRAFIDADPRRKRFAATAKRDYRAMVSAGRVDGG